MISEIKKYIPLKEINVNDIVQGDIIQGQRVLVESNGEVLYGKLQKVANGSLNIIDGWKYEGTVPDLSWSKFHETKLNTKGDYFKTQSISENTTFYKVKNLDMNIAKRLERAFHDEMGYIC